MGITWQQQPGVFFTAGYEGVSIAKFLAALRAAGVSTVIDVRRNAVSRKKGFSKSALRAHLGRVGIGYIHDSRLGAPKAARARLQEAGDYDAFFRAYAGSLDQEHAAFERLLEQLSREICCLMCFESDQERCHRSVLAERVVAVSGGALKAEHIEWTDQPSGRSSVS